MKLVNLLPKDKQRELHNEEVFHGLVFFIEIMLATLVLVFVIQFGVRVYLGQQIRSIDKDINELHVFVDKEDNADLKKQISSLNGYMTDFNALAAATPAWSQVMRAFAQHIPEGVRIQSFATNQAEASIEIEGVAETRDQVITLHDNIERDADHFYNIDYPLENISRPTNVEFHFTFYIHESLLLP